MNVLADVMIIDAAQLLHFKAVLGVTNHNNGMSKQHAAPNVVDHQEEACFVRDIDHVHLVVFIELEKLHLITLQSDLLRLLRIHSMFMWWSSSSSSSTSLMSKRI